MPQDLNQPPPPQEPVGGYVYKGLPKGPSLKKPGEEIPGQDLGEQGFRVKLHEPALHLTIKDAYGGKILPNNQGVIVPFLRVYLPAETARGNLDCFYGQATQGGGYILKCTGQRIYSRKVKQTIDPAKLIRESGVKGMVAKRKGTYETWQSTPVDEYSSALAQGSPRGEVGRR
jgi:hypothetical protein